MQTVTAVLRIRKNLIEQQPPVCMKTPAAVAAAIGKPHPDPRIALAFFAISWYTGFIEQPKTESGAEARAALRVGLSDLPEQHGMPGTAVKSNGKEESNNETAEQ